MRGGYGPSILNLHRDPQGALLTKFCLESFLFSLVQPADIRPGDQGLSMLSIGAQLSEIRQRLGVLSIERLNIMNLVFPRSIVGLL